ncbi:hypothetical protein [Ohtaekwangia sp.]|uniref:hypothetical protein n=1 Tax=Ohtaekwangia sp. TaxID=2066019 RepID=UPI002F944508
MSLEEAFLIVCRVCSVMIFSESVVGAEPVKAEPVPEDWSFLKIGSAGIYKEQPFTIVGRIRLQLRNDYKNFWSAVYSTGKCLWIAESFGSFSVFTTSWERYTKSPSKLRADKSIQLNEDIAVRGEYVERCERLRFEGEIGQWPALHRGFFVIQASNNNGETAMFTVHKKENVYILTGEKVARENLKLTNILEWDEWK